MLKAFLQTGHNYKAELSFILVPSTLHLSLQPTTPGFTCHITYFLCLHMEIAASLDAILINLLTSPLNSIHILPMCYCHNLQIFKC